MKNEKVKIGGVEYTLPFKLDEDLDQVTDAFGNFVCDAYYDLMTFKQGKAMHLVIADALNLKFGYRTPGEESAVEHFGD